jgi:hypothetical protein
MRHADFLEYCPGGRMAREMARAEERSAIVGMVPRRRMAALQLDPGVAGAPGGLDHGGLVQDPREADMGQRFSSITQT